MRQIWEYVKKEKIGIIITFVLSVIVTLFFGYYFLFLGQERVDIRYSFDTKNIANVMSQENIEYANILTKNLSVTIVEIYNKGTKALNGSSILKKSPLSVHLNENCKIVEVYKNDKKTTPYIDYKLNADDKTIIINFDMLNPNDRIVFSILHTGTTNEDVFITGKWENYNGLRNESNDIQTILKIFKIKYYILYVFFILFSLLVLFMTNYTVKKYRNAILNIKKELQIALEQINAGKES